MAESAPVVWMPPRAYPFRGLHAAAGPTPYIIIIQNVDFHVNKNKTPHFCGVL